MSEEQVERRLAAILAADVVGYSRLMEANEERTMGALKQHRREFFDPTVAKHSGRIFKAMGDGFLVEFGSVLVCNFTQHEHACTVLAVQAANGWQQLCARWLRRV